MVAILADDNFKCIFLNKNAWNSDSNRRQAITRTNADPVHLQIYAALGGDELKT